MTNSNLLSYQIILQRWSAKAAEVLQTYPISAQVQPIIDANCIGCHDASTGFKLTNYQQVDAFARSGQLTGCITGDQSFLQMPPGTQMDSCSLKAIVNWVQQGKLDN